MKYITIFLMLILLSVVVSADGTCSLDKYDYSPGENMVFSCTCTSPIEENQPGFIVVRNSTSVIFALPISSGSCRTDIFGSNYVIPQGTNYTGNVTFALNADGTGFPVNWDGVSDVNYDDFNISGSHKTDCIIKFLPQTTQTYSFDIGELAALQIEVSDGITSEYLVHSNCNVKIFTKNGVEIPKFQEPYMSGDSSIESGANGRVIFQNEFNQNIWEPNKTYIARASCYCTPNGTDEECYRGNNSVGQTAGFKSCETELLFDTGLDLRTINNPILLIAYVLIPLILSFILLFIGYELKNYKHVPMKIFLSSLGLVNFFSAIWFMVIAVNGIKVEIIESLATYGYIVGVIVFILIVYWFIIIIKVAFDNMAEKKRQKLEY